MSKKLEPEQILRCKIASKLSADPFCRFQALKILKRKKIIYQKEDLMIGCSKKVYSTLFYV